jgi:hypothetical protein
MQSTTGNFHIHLSRGYLTDQACRQESNGKDYENAARSI